MLFQFYSLFRITSQKFSIVQTPTLASILRLSNLHLSQWKMVFRSIIYAIWSRHLPHFKRVLRKIIVSGQPLCQIIVNFSKFLLHPAGNIWEKFCRPSTTRLSVPLLLPVLYGDKWCLTISSIWPVTYLLIEQQIWIEKTVLQRPLNQNNKIRFRTKIKTFNSNDKSFHL